MPHALRVAAGQGPASVPSAPTFVARSTKFRRALAQLERYAKHDRVPVLLQGESGTGKTYFAAHLHLSSPRARQVFHSVVLSCLNDSLAGSDLFGHVAGAFTDARHRRPGHFASAHGGTLFLDEIGKASPVVQRHLLHAMECGEVWPVGSDRAVRIDVRVVMATNVPLESLVEEDKFLPDLVPRLGCFRVCIPPLRERTADLPGLVAQFVSARAPQFGYPPGTCPRVHPELMRALQNAAWPNNLRQLDATIQRLLADAEGAPLLTTDHCTDDLDYLRPGMPRRQTALSASDFRRAVADARSVAAAARRLGVARSTVYRALGRARAEPEDAAGLERLVSLPLASDLAGPADTETQIPVAGRDGRSLARAHAPEIRRPAAPAGSPGGASHRCADHTPAAV